MLLFGICICICISLQKMSEIKGVVDFCWIPARCHETKFLEAILGHLHWITIDLPREFWIENVILHLLAKTEGNRRGRQSLQNPCWIPAETPAYFPYIKPSNYVLTTLPLPPRRICLQLAMQNDSGRHRRLFFLKNDNTIHNMVCIMKKSKTSINGYPTCSSYSV